VYTNNKVDETVAAVGWSQVNATGNPYLPHVRAQNALAPTSWGWYIFGGWGASHILDCFWNYTVANSSWDRFTPNAVDEGGPTRREGQRAQVTDNLYIFGGVDNQIFFKTYNELWQYDFSTCSWTNFSFTGLVPSARAYHTLNYLGNNQFLIFGGYDFENNTVSDSCWLFNSAANSWTPVNTALPPNRAYHTALTDSSNTFVYLFSGVDSNGNLLEDMWSYSIYTNSWSTVVANNGNSPAARKGHVMWLVGDFIYIYGGDDNQTVFDDLWSFNLNTNTWTEIQTNSAPDPPRTNLGYGAYVNGALYLFAGASVSQLNTNLTDIFDDVWYIPLPQYQIN